MAKDTKTSQPKEAEVMTTILKEMGISEYEPGVVNQMLEFTYRYVSQILDDSRAYANYAKKSKPIDVDDVKLSIHMHVERSLTTPPPRDLLLELSRTRNSNPLPAIKPQCGIRLPPDRYCLSACNMKLRASSRKGSGGGGGSKGGVGGSSSPLTPLKPNISIVTSKTGASSPTVTLLQKGVAAAPAQKIVSVNRPLIKVTPGPPGGSSPKIQISSGSSLSSGLKLSAGSIKTEEEKQQQQQQLQSSSSSSSSSSLSSSSSSTLKRKREDDDYDA